MNSPVSPFEKMGRFLATEDGKDCFWLIRECARCDFIHAVTCEHKRHLKIAEWYGTSIGLEVVDRYLNGDSERTWHELGDLTADYIMGETSWEELAGELGAIISLAEDDYE